MAAVSLNGSEELFSGVLFKCGGKVKSWNRRFFVLKSDYYLYYFKDTSKGALGAISLKDPKFKARKGEASDVSWPKQTKLDCTMAIITSHRTYCTYSMYSHEIEEWISLLTDAREKVLSQAIAGNRLLSGGRSVSSSQVEQKHKDKPKARPLSTGQPVTYDSPGEKNPAVAGYEIPEPAVIEAVYALATEEQVFYEDVDLKPEVSEKATPTVSDVYEEMSPQPEDIGPTEQLPTQQPLYDAILDTAQPLYEDIPLQHSADTYVTPQDEQEWASPSDPPPLPHRPGAPSLPPRPEVSPPIPPKDTETAIDHPSATLTSNNGSPTNDTPIDATTPSCDAVPIPSDATTPSCDAVPIPSDAGPTPPMYDTPPDDTTPPSSGALPNDTIPTCDGNPPIDITPREDVPPTNDTPPNDTAPTCNTGDTPPTGPGDTALETHVHEDTPAQEERKPVPAPRRRSFSPNQQSESRVHHGMYTCTWN
jgi:hypothetical protein